MTQFTSDPTLLRTGTQGNIATILHGSEASMRMESAQIGQIQEITFSLNGQEKYFKEIGTPFPTTHRVSAFNPRGSFKVGSIDLSEMALVEQLMKEGSDPVTFFATDPSAFKPVSFPVKQGTSGEESQNLSIFPYVFDIDIGLDNYGDGAVSITLHNCEVSNATHNLVNNEFIITDVTFIFTHYSIQDAANIVSPN